MPCCKTIFELKMRGSFTSAFAVVKQKKKKMVTIKIVFKVFIAQYYFLVIKIKLM